MGADLDQRCKASEDRGFSSAFWRLVDHETDVSGFVAYGFYKFYKYSQIEDKEIKSRSDKTLDIFGLHPDLAKGFKVRANEFLEKANSNVSTAAAVSAQSKQLKDIGDFTRKKNFWWNVLASATATILLATLPISIALLHPDFRQSVGLWVIRSVASVSIDRPKQAMDVIVKKLDADERKRYVRAIIVESVEQSVDPTFVLDAVIESFDRNPPKDNVILEHILAALKRADESQKLAGEIFLREVMPAAGPPNHATEN